MKITFESLKESQNSDRVNAQDSKEGVKVASLRSPFVLDISGGDGSYFAYGSAGKKVEDVMQEAQNQNLDAKRNYMAVMADSITGEDYLAMKDSGYPPMDLDVETTVTIVDKIKVELAKSGVVVAGYNDQMSQEKMEEITGSIARAGLLEQQFQDFRIPMTQENVRKVQAAMDLAGQITALPEGAEKYLIENRSDLSIENVYVAQYTKASENRQKHGYFPDEMPGYYAKKAEEIHWEQIEDRIQKVMESSGLEVSEETTEEAKWIVKQGILLNEQTMTRMHDLKSLVFPISEETSSAVALSAMEMAQEPRKGLLTQTQSLMQRAQQLYEDTHAITPDAAQQLVEDGIRINLRNLSASQRTIVHQKELANREVTKQEDNTQPVTSKAAVTALRQLEEIRLHMTVEANMRLMRKGFSIRTESLEKVVTALVEEEEQSLKLLYQGQDSKECHKREAACIEANKKITELSSMPAAVLGKAVVPGSVFTLNYMHVQGSVMKSQYEQAGERYETLMTVPRADLGDRLQKAFRNVEDILHDLGEEGTQSNQRAVRILAYNQMPITQENLYAVKSADLEMNSVIQKLTPIAVANLVREGVDLLNWNISELGEYLDSQEGVVDHLEKYSTYLHKLEQKKQITPEEKEAYIGMYRLLRQIEKSDGAVVGALVHTGAELTLQNLVSALRSRSHRGMDVSVDSSFGVLQGEEDKSTSITEQIRATYAQKTVKDALSHMDPEHLGTISVTRETTILELRDELAKEQAVQNSLEEDLQQIRKLKDVSDEAIQTLLEHKIPVTAHHALAAEGLVGKRGSTYRTFGKIAEEYMKAEQGAQEEVQDAIQGILEGMEDSQALQEAYKKFQEAAGEVFEQVSMASYQQMDVRTMLQCYRQISLATTLAKEEHYEVPLQLQEGLVTVHLRVLRKDGETSQMHFESMETEQFGKLTGDFWPEGSTLCGMILFDREEASESVQELVTQVSTSLKEQGIQVGSLETYYHSGYVSHQRNSHVEGSSSAKELYKVAKILLQSMVKYDNSRYM